MVGAAVLIIKIIGMFPHVESEQWGEAFLHGVGGIGFLADDEFAIRISGEPHPAGAEEGGTGLHELFLKCLERAELRIDGGGQFASGTVVGLRSSELQEIEVVVQNLSGIVEHSASGFLHDFLQRHRLERSARNGGVQVVDIPLQMFSVVKSDSLGRNNWFQSVGLVRQVDQFKFSHDDDNFDNDGAKIRLFELQEDRISRLSF